MFDAAWAATHVPKLRAQRNNAGWENAGMKKECERSARLSKSGSHGRYHSEERPTERRERSSGDMSRYPMDTTEAARRLGVSRSALYERLRVFECRPDLLGKTHSRRGRKYVIYEDQLANIERILECREHLGSRNGATVPATGRSTFMSPEDAYEKALNFVIQKRNGSR